MAKLFANSGDSDQTPHSVASDLGLHVCQLPFKGSPDYSGLYSSQHRLYSDCTNVQADWRLD